MVLFKRASSILVTSLVVLKSLTILAQKPNLKLGDINVLILTGDKSNLFLDCALIYSAY
jgi:hypothetical protein